MANRKRRYTFKTRHTKRNGGKFKLKKGRKAKSPQPVFHINPEHHISPAFEVEGKTYSQFTDSFNIPSERAFAALHHYEKLMRRADDRYLKTFSEAIDGILSHPTIVKIGELSKLNNDLKERLNMFFPPNLIYDLASVLFFDETENPYTYDQAYAEKKISIWKKHKDITDFFLLMPFRSLIPQSEYSKQDFRNILKATLMITEKHWENLIPHFLSNPKKESFIRNVLLQIKQEQEAYT